MSSAHAQAKVIFVNRFFYPDLSATSQMLTDLATALAGRGLRVTVITSRLRYDTPEERLAARETVGGVDVHRLATSGFGRASLIGRALDYLTFYTAAAWALFRHARRGDVIVAKTDPPMLSVIAAPIAWMRGARLVNWLQDIFPEVAETLAVKRGGWTLLVFRLLGRLRDRSLRGARFNVVLGERMAVLVAGRGAAPPSIRIIANWADGRLIRPIPPSHNILRREWGLTSAFVVGYSGNLGRAHDVATFIDAIEHLEKSPAVRRRDSAPAAEATPHLAHFGGRERGLEAVLDEDPPIRWLFVGGGALSQHLRAEAEKRRLRSVQFRPYQSRERLAESLCVPDLHLVSLRPELEGLIVPSKYYGIAAAGRPTIFIGDGDGEIARLITRNSTGTVVSEGDGIGLAEAIGVYARDAPRTLAQGARARAVFEERLNLPFAIAAWEHLLREALR